MLNYYRINGKVHASLTIPGDFMAMCGAYRWGGKAYEVWRATRDDFLANPCQHCLRKLGALGAEIREVTHDDQ